MNVWRKNNLYIHNVDLMDPVDLDPQFYFAHKDAFQGAFNFLEKVILILTDSADSFKFCILFADCKIKQI